MKTFNFVSGLPTLTPLETENIDGKRFYCTPSGEKYPSVTTVLGHFKKKKIVEWRNRVGAAEADKITNKAATRGTRFHTLMENYVSNDPTLPEQIEKLMPDTKAHFLGLLPTLDKIDNIYYVESPLYSHKMRIAGRTDVIGEFNSILSVIDFKTSLKLKKEHWIENYFEQETCYALMLKELTGLKVQQIVTIIAVDGYDEPQVFIKNPKDYTDSALTKIFLYHKEHDKKC